MLHVNFAKFLRTTSFTVHYAKNEVKDSIQDFFSKSNHIPI